MRAGRCCSTTRSSSTSTVSPTRSPSPTPSGSSAAKPAGTGPSTAACTGSARSHGRTGDAAMKVLVSGSSGFIGQWVSLSLAAGGHGMVPYDHPDDVCDLKALLAACEDVGGIIHLAGRLGTSELLGSEHEAAKVNILGAVNAYDVATQLGIPLVQIGTGHKGQPNTYAITKACAEDLAL